MLTTCPAAALAWSHAHNACADAALDNAIHDPARDVTPVGTPHCKIACTNVHGEWRKARSNPADRTAAPKNLRASGLCAGPRTANPRQLTPLAARAPALDIASTVRIAVACRSRSRDTADSPASTANGEPRGDILHCNSAIVDVVARTAVHSP
jgi:predicted component of type VI protein secretion system